MNVRTLTLGSAAIAAALFCALPASAMPGYTRDSTPAERAQTEALNSGAADRAHGNTATDAAANDNYNANRATYDRGMQDHAVHQAAYDRDMARYNNRWNRHGGANNMIAVDFGSVAFAYNDGYWDNGRHWHAWRNDAESRGYRNHHGSNFHSWNHDRDHDNGWQRH
jgi:hypothetical protein